VLLAVGSHAWSELQEVSVSLSGPSVGWVNQELAYVADGDYDLGEEECPPEEITVTETYDWGFGGGTCTTEPADSESESCEFDYEDGGQYHTISVTYTVTVTYPDESSEEDFATDSIDVKVQRIEISVAADDSAICTGAVATAPHQTTITATVTNGFNEGVSGKSVSFSADHEYNLTGPSLSPNPVVSGGGGLAQTTLTSGDGVVSGAVTATCGELNDETTVSFEAPTDEFSFVDPQTGEPLEWLPADGESHAKVIVHLTHEGSDVSGHSVTWIFRLWGEDKNPAQDDPDYEGTGQSPYGSISPIAGTTNAEGETYTIYTAGTTPGWIEFKVTEGKVFHPVEG